MYFKVAAGCSVLLKDNVIREAGATIFPNEISRLSAADLVKTKHLIAFDENSPKPPHVEQVAKPVVKTTEQFSTKAPAPEPERVEDIPGVVPPPVMRVENNTPAPGTLSNAGSTAEAVKTEVRAVEVAPNPTQPAGVMTSKWNFAPANLERLTVEQLNAMIIERDGNVKPFDTKEEAIAMLSQDFKG